MNEPVEPNRAGFRESLLRAFDEGRMDDLVLMIANRLRMLQEAVSPHTRASLPVDDTIANPIRNTLLTPEEIDNFDIRDRGWHLVAIRNHSIVGAERFAVRADDPTYKARITECMEVLLGYYGEDSNIFAAYHVKGMLVEWQFLHNFVPESRQY